MSSKDSSKSPIDIAHENGKFEILSFDKHLDRNAEGFPTWLSHMLLEGMSKDDLREVVDTPGWDADAMQISITLNGRRIVFADFEKVCSYFANRMYEDKLARANFANFEKAVEIRAKGIIKTHADELQDKLHDLHQQLENLTGVTGDIVQREWDAPFLYQITDDMERAALNALGRFFDTEPDVNFEGNSDQSEADAKHHAKQAISEIYKAMVHAREKREPRTIKLPAAHNPDIHHRFNTTRRIFLDQIKDCLAEQGLLFEEVKP